MDIDSSSLLFSQTIDLLNFKTFSLTSYGLIENYDNEIVPLLHRMLNLKNLTLYLRIDYQYRFIDPIDFLDRCSIHLSQLNSFKFYLSVINIQNHFVQYLSPNNRKMKYENISAMFKSIKNIL